MSFWEILQSFFKIIISLFTSLLTFLGIITGQNEEIIQTVVCEIPAQGEVRTVQGACQDGNFIYISQINSSGTDARIIKYNLSFELVSISENLALDHANDLTYCAQTNEIAVSNNEPNFTTVTFVNADTLTVTKSVGLSEPLYAIEYVGDENCYYTGISYTYKIVKYNENFEKISEIPLFDNGLTRQGIAINGDKIYCVYSGENSIYQYDFSGSLIKSVTLPESDNEAESLFFLNDTPYVVYNIPGTGNGGIIYKLEGAF